jgi:serpin B
MHYRLRRVAFISGLLAATACGSDGITGPIEQLPRPLTAAEQQVIARANGFGFELLSQVRAREDGPNVFLSPLSASMALGMTMNGAAGQTWDEMSATLGFDGLTEDEINRAYRDLLDLLNGLDPRVDFRIGNAIWANANYTFVPAFFDRVSTWFDAEARSAPFTPATLAEINGWVGDATNGRIEKILDRLDRSLIMLLLNAIYFKGDWTMQFDPADTRTEAFTRADGSQVDVPMMSLDDEFAFTATSDHAAVELPYGGQAYSMLVVVPQPGRTLDDVAADLDPATWTALTGSLQKTRVHVGLPRFEIRYEELLNEPLMAMGMETPFTGNADFSRMLTTSACMSFVLQKSFVKVDEKGTEAAAVTVVGIAESAPPSVVADRPFLFAIRERFSGTILFIGTIGDPTAAESAPAESPRGTCG